jgi:hypothetical protein
MNKDMKKNMTGVSPKHKKGAAGMKTCTAPFTSNRC